jgi:hypothetical protein
MNFSLSKRRLFTITIPIALLSFLSGVGCRVDQNTLSGDLPDTYPTALPDNPTTRHPTSTLINYLTQSLPHQTIRRNPKQMPIQTDSITIDDHALIEYLNGRSNGNQLRQIKNEFTAHRQQQERQRRALLHAHHSRSPPSTGKPFGRKLMCPFPRLVRT